MKKYKKKNHNKINNYCLYARGFTIYKSQLRRKQGVRIKQWSVKAYYLNYFMRIGEIIYIKS